MDDYSALAQRIAVSVSGVRGSLILSRDGLVLGAFPAGDEGHAKTAWLRFVTLGEPEKSFVEFPDQVWAFVKRGPYAAFSVAEAGTRPGILLDTDRPACASAWSERHPAVISGAEALGLAEGRRWVPASDPNGVLRRLSGSPSVTNLSHAVFAWPSSPAGNAPRPTRPWTDSWARTPDTSRLPPWSAE